MAGFYTTGTWTPKDGEDQQFVAAWQEFADWASAQPGAGVLRLARNLGEDGGYVSFGLWGSLDQIHVWKASPEFRDRMGRVQAHVARFAPAELEVIADAGSDA